MARGATWTNSDGLVVGFGTHTVDNDIPVVTAGAGAVKTLIMEITGVDTVDTITAADIPPQSARIRRGSTILSATLVTTVAWTGAGTLDIGTWGVGLATEVVDDADGIDVDIDIDAALAAVGDTVQCNGALVNGAVTVGETSNSDCVITASWETAVPTAGKAVLTVQYIEPQYDATLAV
jgi:hypothetical protein